MELAPKGTIDPATGKITGFSVAANSSVEVTYKQNYANFGIETYDSNGKAVKQNFNIQGSDSLNSVINKVNSSSVGVTMFYDSFSDKMTLTRSQTGDFNSGGSEIVTSGQLNTAFQFGASTESGGSNAVFVVNGLETQRNSNTFEMNGVSITLKQTFTNNTAEDPTLTYSAPVNISVNKNTDEIYNNIKGFIDKYNELIDKIGKKVSEDRYKDYTPLTDTQKEQLSDKQQEQWEEKAKSGLLRRDSTLSSLLSSMRTDFYGAVNSDSVSPSYKQLTSIGISTKPYAREGKLEVDEAKLKKAIEEDPESVEKLFNATGSTYEQKGIAQRLYDTVNKTIDTLTTKAGSAFITNNNSFAIGKQLNTINDQIDRFEDRMKSVEDRYYRQFTAMEKAIQQANSQSANLATIFSIKRIRRRVTKWQSTIPNSLISKML